MSSRGYKNGYGDVPFLNPLLSSCSALLARSSEHTDTSSALALLLSYPGPEPCACCRANHGGAASLILWETREEVCWCFYFRRLTQARL